jgi:hypothetical protein
LTVQIRRGIAYNAFPSPTATSPSNPTPHSATACPSPLQPQLPYTSRPPSLLHAPQLASPWRRQGDLSQEAGGAAAAGRATEAGGGRGDEGGPHHKLGAPGGHRRRRRWRRAWRPRLRHPLRPGQIRWRGGYPSSSMATREEMAWQCPRIRWLPVPSQDPAAGRPSYKIHMVLVGEARGGGGECAMVAVLVVVVAAV